MSIQVRQPTVEAPWLAKQVRLQCPHCHGFCHVSLPWKPTGVERQRLIQAAIDEHRQICTKATAEEARVYTINYPRK